MSPRCGREPVTSRSVPTLDRTECPESRSRTGTGSPAPRSARSLVARCDWHTCHMKFRDLYFGQADARTEAIRQPEGFVRSFVDHREITASVVDQGKFLVLGPKGAGKSALAWFLQATSRDRGLLVHPRDVSELPIADVAQLKTGDSPGVSRSLNAWRFILLCALINVILEDQGSGLSKNLEAMSVIAKLREYGFLDPTPKAAILRASKSTWKVPIPHVGEIFSRESSDSLHLAHLLPYLQKWVSAEDSSHNRHLLILDGLDSIYLNDAQYIPALSALVQSAWSLNQDLRGAEASGNIVLLLRNDVFSRLDLPDGGKVRSDWAVELDWRILSGDAASAPLFELVDRKSVSLTGAGPTDVVGTLFPDEIRLQGRGPERDVYNYLLNLTRHTPRDLLQLLEHIRRVDAADRGSEFSPRLRQETIREGVLQYATKYFVDAVRNELVGRGGSGDSGRAVVDALRDLGARRFTFDDYKTSLENVSSGVSVPSADEALRWLFFAGAIGNEVGNGDTRYLQFFHRRDDNDIYLRGTLLVHNALVYAWALPWN